MNKSFLIFVYLFLTVSLQATEIVVSLDKRFFHEIKNFIPKTIQMRDLPKGLSITPFQIKYTKLKWSKANTLKFWISLKAYISYYREKFGIKIKKSPRKMEGKFLVQAHLRQIGNSIFIYPEIQEGEIFERQNNFFDIFYPHIEKFLFDEINQKLVPISLPIETKNIKIKAFGWKKTIGKLRIQRFEIKKDRMYIYLALKGFPDTKENVEIKAIGNKIYLKIHRNFFNAFKEKYLISHLRKFRFLNLPIVLQDLNILSFQKNGRVTFKITEKYSKTQSLITWFEIFIKCKRQKILFSNLKMNQAKASYPLNPKEMQMMLRTKFFQKPIQIFPKMKSLSLGNKAKLKFTISRLHFEKNNVMATINFRSERK